jgi:hypothetical protein
VPKLSRRRHRHHGQSRQSQGQSGAAAHSLGWRQTLLPAEILTRPNPIEQVFAKLKHLLRKVGARQVEPIGAAIGETLGAFTAQEYPTISETQAMHQPKIIMLLAPAAARRPSPVHHSRG